MATSDQITVDNKHQMAQQLSQLDSSEVLHYIDSNLQYGRNLEGVFQRSAGISDGATEIVSAFPQPPFYKFPPPFQKISKQIIKSRN
jgi:hypothetical protein